MPLPSFADLHAWADQRAQRLTVAAIGADDTTVLAALTEARARGWVEPILVGSSSAIAAAANEAGIPLDGFRIVDATDAAPAAVEEVRAGRAQLLMKGRVDTPVLMHALLDPAAGLRSGRTICQVVLMEIIDQQRRFLLADTGVTIQPTLDQKIEILESLIAVAGALGTRSPRVAVVAASEKASPAMPETLDAAEMAGRNRAGEYAGAVVEGPLSFDLAYAPDAAMRKQVEGAVAGSADAMLFPDLAAANLTVKAIIYTAQCQFGGVLSGATCPIAFMSRADTPQTRLNSLALALCLANDRA